MPNKSKMAAETANIETSPTRIRRMGSEIVILPPHDSIEQVLRVGRVTVSTSADGVALRRCSEPLFWKREDGPSGPRLVGPAAAEPLVAGLLGAVKMASKLTGRRPQPLELDAVSAGLTDLPLLARITRHPHLLVRYSPGVHVSWLLIQTCRAWPSLRTVVLAKRGRDVRKITQLLKKHNLPAVAFHCGVLLDVEEGRVAVTTYQSSGHCAVGLWNADLLVLVDALDACESWGREVVEMAHLTHPTAPRVLAFAPADFRPSLNDAAYLLRTVGPVEVTVPAHGTVARSVEFVFVPHTVKLASGKHADMTTEKNSGKNMMESANTTMVDNTATSMGEIPSAPIAATKAAVASCPVLLRRTAALASGLALGDGPAVATRFPQLAGHRLLGRRSAVLVVAADVVQARRLLRKLPGWAGVGPDLGDWPSPSPWLFVSEEQPAPGVCTFAGLRDVSVGKYDAVIRLDGAGGALPTVPEATDSAFAFSGTSRVPVEPLLLIDFEPLRHRRLQRIAARRRAAYETLSWTDIGSGLTPELTRFFANQLEARQAWFRLQQETRNEVKVPRQNQRRLTRPARPRETSPQSPVRG